MASEGEKGGQSSMVTFMSLPFAEPETAKEFNL